MPPAQFFDFVEDAAFEVRCGLVTFSESNVDGSVIAGRVLAKYFAQPCQSLRNALHRLLFP